jgi:hypothetical protein
VLKKEPGHVGALFNCALFEYQNKHNVAKAKEYLNRAGKGKGDPGWSEKAFTLIAQIDQEEQQQKAAEAKKKADAAAAAAAAAKAKQQQQQQQKQQQQQQQGAPPAGNGGAGAPATQPAANPKATQ